MFGEDKIERKKILISPLDWGLGHATRCVPIVHKLLSSGFDVTIAGSGRSLQYLSKQFPQLPVLELPGFSPKYSKKGSVFYKIVWQMPAFLKCIYKEHFLLIDIQKKYNFDYIISDNRYGLFCKGANSIIITHQLKVYLHGIFKLFEKPLQVIIRMMLKKFDQVWVPDFGDDVNLSGVLSHSKYAEKNYEYIGLLSRFSTIDESDIDTNLEKAQIVAIISGSEPQRTILEKILLEQLVKLPYKVQVFNGKPEKEEVFKLSDNVTVFSNASNEQLYTSIKNAEVVICRSGYSSLMDLAVFKSKAIVIPTRGQTEQEYLAKILDETKQAHSVYQEDIFLPQDISIAKQYSGVGSGLYQTFCLDIDKLLP